MGSTPITGDRHGFDRGVACIGWKEYEMEVMRDKDGQCRDHLLVSKTLTRWGSTPVTAITVAPAQTLTDKEYQRMRDASLRCLSAIGVETGGSNVQFALNPADGRMIVIEMNPRVSRSSALASKATGFPIARVAAKLAIGYTLDEIENAITRQTMAAFEPSIDYVVVKAPRFNFDKFPEADDTLTTRMKSVGEAMAIGGNFREAFQKALRSLEDGFTGFVHDTDDYLGADTDWATRFALPKPTRYRDMASALQHGVTVEQLHEWTKVDPWFLNEMATLNSTADGTRGRSLDSLDATELRELKANGFSDRQLGHFTGSDESDVRQRRHELTCARSSRPWIPAPPSSRRSRPISTARTPASRVRRCPGVASAW